MVTSSTSQKATDSVANAMVPNIMTGRRAFMEKEPDTLWGLAREPIISALIAMTLISQDLNR